MLVIAVCTVVVELEIVRRAVEVARPPRDMVPSAAILRTFAPVEEARVRIGEVVAIACIFMNPLTVVVPTFTFPANPMSKSFAPVELASVNNDFVDNVEVPWMNIIDDDAVVVPRSN